MTASGMIRERRADGRTETTVKALVLLPLLLTARPPVVAAVQCPDGTPPPCRAGTRAVAPAGHTVAVLYFDNLSRDTADAYIAEGLTEEVTARLGQVERLGVVSRTAVRRLRNAAALSTPELGRSLNAAYLVNGSVRRAGPRLRVTVELVRAASGARVWGEVYDRGDQDLLALQEDIARAVAVGITGRLLPAERARIAARPTSVAAAYDHYLRGARMAANVSAQSILGAIAEFEAALRLDAGFTRARAAIAVAYGLAANWGASTPALPLDTLLARGLAAADRALRSDSTSADAWMARGALLMFIHPATFDGALDALRRATRLDPEHAEALGWYGIALRRLGRYDEALTALRRAGELDPRGLVPFDGQAFIALARRDYPTALRLYDSIMVRDSVAWQFLTFRARAHMAAGDAFRAVADAQHAVRLAGSQLTAEATLVQALAARGDTAAARARLAPLLPAARADSVWVRDGYELALALVALGDTARGLDVLERTRPRGPWLWSYLMLPGFDAVRASARFQRLEAALRPPGAQ